MRILGAVALVASLVVSNAVAYAASPLPSGKPAGAHEAALLGPNAALILIGTAVFIGGIVAVASNNSNNGVTTPSTTSTSTAGLP